MYEEDCKKIVELLDEMHPTAAPELVYKNAFQLLIAVILSAQCTDKRVNAVTAELFSKYSEPSDFAKLSVDTLAAEIKSCGLANSKAKGIVETCKILTEKYGGEVPHTIEELRALPSVGRKTANVVASVAFGVPAIAVDTHVFRVSNRIGLCECRTVEKTEEALMAEFPREVWSHLHHLLIFQGRYVCKAQKPLCEECKLKEMCKFYKERDKR